MRGSPTTTYAVNLLLKRKMLQAILMDRSLSPAAKVVAARLLDRYNTKTGRCDSSYTTITSDVGYTRRQVIRVVTELRQKGWVTTSRSSTKLPSNEFEFAWLKISGEPPDALQSGDTAVTSSEFLESAKVVKQVTPVSLPDDNHVTATGDTFVPQVVTELAPKYGNVNRKESGKGIVLSAADAAPTPASILFDDCRKYLESTTGMSADRTRGIVGGWRKNCSDDEIVDAFRRAQRHEAQDAVAFISGFAAEANPAARRCHVGDCSYRRGRAAQVIAEARRRLGPEVDSITAEANRRRLAPLLSPRAMPKKDAGWADAEAISNDMRCSTEIMKQ
jgi:Helix-turn-helix domain